MFFHKVVPRTRVLALSPTLCSLNTRNLHTTPSGGTREVYHNDYERYSTLAVTEPAHYVKQVNLAWLLSLLPTMCVCSVWYSSGYKGKNSLSVYVDVDHYRMTVANFNCFKRIWGNRVALCWVVRFGEGGNKQAGKSERHELCIFHRATWVLQQAGGRSGMSCGDRLWIRWKKQASCDCTAVQQQRGLSDTSHPLISQT